MQRLPDSPQRKASRRLNLVLIGALASAGVLGQTGCTEEAPNSATTTDAVASTAAPAARDLYASVDDCKADWGDRASECSPAKAAEFDPEGLDRPKMMSIGMHCRLLGKPGRIGSLRRFLDHVQQREGVWICRRVDIARHWKATHPFDAARAHVWT